MLLGTYRCTDISGEFEWQAGVLTQAVSCGNWLLLDVIYSAARDVASILSNVMQTVTLSVPGCKDTFHVNSGFQLFFTQRLIPMMSGFQCQSSGASSLFEKHLLCINMESLSKKELSNNNTDSDEDDELFFLKT
ncbi:midasin-like [Copidosoma floridanum]|uniref:midasin-like n=1 Tax=Copidosoma floridanum TaxID=29053 RepID=UPI000C6FC6D1|nr:midasin-like [Copidosoma floridanum]